jgi:hypothetical protein
MSEPLVSPRFLFHFAVPCRYRDPLWTDKGTMLGEEHRLVHLAELDERGAGPDFRAAWSEAGLAFRLEVRGKKQPPWCRATQPAESDGFHVWIDTRNVQNVHRASRFCHRLFFLPAGDGRGLALPAAGVLPINRARTPHGPIHPDQLVVLAEKHSDGYVLHAHVMAEALTGFDPVDHPALGFTYALIDHELGERTFGPGRPLPYDEDPSLWSTLELVGK